MSKPNWVKKSTALSINSPWLDLYREEWVDSKGALLDYWRIEKDDSIIVVPTWNNYLLLPNKSFRPGVSKCTYDFPGGRYCSAEDKTNIAKSIVCRELSISEGDIQFITCLNLKKWNVNSSFSNQGVWIFDARISSSVNLEQMNCGLVVEYSDEEISRLLLKLECLQCIAALMYWQRHVSRSSIK